MVTPRVICNLDGMHIAVATPFEISLDRRPNLGRLRLTDSSFSLTKSLRTQEEFAVRRRCSMHSSMKLGDVDGVVPLMPLRPCSVRGMSR